MPQNNNFDFLDETGSSAFEPAKYDTLFEQKFGEFVSKAQANARAKGLIASGEMLSNDSFSFKIVNVSESVTEIQLLAKYYSKFVDKGVKGWGSSKNAPRSEYQFKTKGMSAEGRASISRYLETNRGKVKNQKYARVGLEKKANESRVDEAVWGIKKYGIKTTNFYTDAFYDTFKDFGKELTDGIKKNFIVKVIEI